MEELLFLTLIFLLLSFVFNKRKTLLGVKMGLKMFMNLLPPFVTVLIILSFVLALLPGELLEKLLGADSGITGFFIAAGLGSVALIPGFISYPLAAVLLKNGVSYPVISVFITTLMMVGIVTLPIEKNFFGWRVAII
nr:permease [Spirochaetota bacterium]